VRDGLAATAELRRRGFNKPILAVSAAAMQEDKDRAINAGCNDHLTKPITARLLLQKVLQYSSAT
jgi:CheY-like chemotaxis protein